MRLSPYPRAARKADSRAGVARLLLIAEQELRAADFGILSQPGCGGERKQTVSILHPQGTDEHSPNPERLQKPTPEASGIGTFIAYRGNRG